MTTLTPTKSYAEMQKNCYRDGTTNHEQHNGNPDYWSILLKAVPNLAEGACGLDFGCGKGRNLTNLQAIGKFAALHGIDISPANIAYCQATYDGSLFSFFENNGLDLAPLASDAYDFAMSTIVFQHIAVHEIRFSLMSEIFRVLKPGGIFSFQMGFGSQYPHFATYFENRCDAQGTNGHCDVTVSNPLDLSNDLKKIGFEDVEVTVRSSWEDPGHPCWIYASARKPEGALRETAWLAF